MHRVVVVNGPNLDLLGIREPSVYGSTTLPELIGLCERWGARFDLEISAFQSNHEGAIIDRIHEAMNDADGIVLNPGAYAHTSYAIHDALASVAIPTVEVHISNIRNRESWRRISVVEPACVHTIYGRGIDGYRAAISHLAYRWRFPAQIVEYGSHPDQFADVREPFGTGPWPATVLVHGGFWRHHLARDVMDGIAVDLAERGMITWNTEYRRVGDGGGATSSLADVRLAIKAAAADPRSSSLTVIGHEAGALLALDASAPGEVDRCITLGGVTDLLAARQSRIGDDAAAGFLGGSPPEALSPIHRLPLGVPVTLFHATADESVPAQHSANYVEAAIAAGDDAEFVELDDGSGILDPAGAAWNDVVTRVAL